MHNETSAAPLIAQLCSQHRQRMVDHLLALSAEDRRLRFGLAVNDDSIRRYVHEINFSRDSVFGALDASAEVVGLGHLAFAKRRATADFGISVLPSMRGRGIALLLLRRAAEHASNRGVHVLEMTFVPENFPLMRLAARAEMCFMRDQFEPRAYLELPRPSNTSVVVEAFDEMSASINLDARVDKAVAIDALATSA